jgi:hypothetical protein
VESAKIFIKTKEAKESIEQIKANYGLKNDRRLN